MARWGLALALAAACLATPAEASGPTVSVGSPSRGSLRDARQLQPRAFLTVKADATTWGHPALLQLLQRGAKAVALAVPGSVALIGDLSARDGGPLPGHVSHQSGRDADVAFFVVDAQGRPVALEAFESFGSDGRSMTNPEHYLDAYRNWLMLRVWLSELRVGVSHVFLSGDIREVLLQYGQHSAEFTRFVPLASRVLQPWAHHTDHFHVRIACPGEDRDRSACIDRAAAP